MEIPCETVFIRPECIANRGIGGAIEEALNRIEQEFCRIYANSPITTENGEEFKIVLYRIKK